MDREEEGVEWDGCRERYVKRGKQEREKGGRKGMVGEGEVSKEGEE